MTKRSFANKVVLVTGGASGIGLATCREFAGAGAKIAMLDMDEPALPSLIQQRGVILVNESVAGVAPLLGRCGYSASKHALHGLFTSLRCEMKHKGVHVIFW